MDHALTGAPPPVLVTGASGFLGARLAAQLLAAGHRVRGLVRASSARDGLPRALEPVVGDLSDPASLRRAVRGQELVLHTAGRVTDWGAREQFWAANVAGAVNLARACVAEGVRRLVHVSSLTVLGFPRDGRWVDEASPAAPAAALDRYSASKLAAEHAVRRVCDRRMELTIVRPGAIWGPGDRTLLPRLERLLRAGLVPLVGDGRNRLGLAHVDNVAQGTRLAATAPVAAGRLYHLTDGELTTARQVLGELATALGAPAPRWRVPRGLLLGLAGLLERAQRARRAPHPPLVTRYAVQALSCDCRYDIGRARRELGYRPRVTLRSGMRQLRQLLGESHPAVASARSPGVLE